MSRPTRKFHKSSGVEAPTSAGRICSGQCGSSKSWTEFDKKSNGVNGFDSRCKKCISKAKKTYKAKEKRKYKETTFLQSKIIGVADQEKIERFSKIISTSIMSLIDEGLLK